MDNHTDIGRNKFLRELYICCPKGDFLSAALRKGK